MTPDELKRHFDTTVGALRTTLTTQQQEISQFGQTRTDTATKLAEQETAIEKLGNEFKELARKAGVPGSEGMVMPKSVGELFIASEAYTNMISNKQHTSIPFQVGKIDPTSKYALVGDSSGGAQVAVPRERVPGFISPATAPFRMRNLIPVQPTKQGAIEYIRTTGFFPVATYTTAATIVGATVVPVTSTAGFAPAISVIVGTEVRTVATVDSDTQLTLSVGLTSAHPATTTRVVSRVVAATPQGKLKPTGEFTNFTLETESVKTIATSVDVARQVLDDVQQLRAFIDNQLMFEMGYTEEYNLLYGDGSSSQLRGLMTEPARQIYLWSAGRTQVVGTASLKDTKIDALRRAITVVQMARYPADGIVIHPYDWQDIELAKGSDGHYLWISVSDGGPQRFFQYPVVVTDAIAQGTALTGSFALGTTLWDREQANIRISDQHADNFKRNLLSLLAEERMAQTIYRPEAFVDVVFDNPPA